jgi:hypothetical protein
MRPAPVCIYRRNATALNFSTVMVSYLAQLLLSISERMILEKSPCYRLPHGSELSQPI